MLTDKQVLELNAEFGLQDAGSSLFGEEVPPDLYQCPLCPGHMDEDDFAWSSLLDAPICSGCMHDIHNGFVGWDERPTPEQYNHADTIELLEQLTGLTFQQLKFQYMKAKIIEWGGAIPEVYRGMLLPDMPDAWLRVVNKQLDREFLRLVENRKGEV